MADFKDLLGKTLTEVVGMEKGSERIEFVCDDGSRFVMCHFQDCCESVRVEDVVGHPSDLIGARILVAEESTSNTDPEGYEPDKYGHDDSFTWTFYKLATMKGYVDLRWLGESNGYYSESVDFDSTSS